MSSYQMNLNMKNAYKNTVVSATEKIKQNVDVIAQEIKRISEMQIPEGNMKLIIDKAAIMVAKDFQMEEKLMSKLDTEEKLQFLRKDHQYRLYFDCKVNDFIKQFQEEKQDFNERKKEKTIADNHITHKTIVTSDINEIKQMLNLKEEKEEIHLPEDFSHLNFNFASNYFLSNCSQSITEQQDLVIKLTAQFVAKNGQYFLSIIQKKEANNHLYEFLKPTNPLFSYFNDLLKGYMNCFLIKKDWKEKLEAYSDILKLDFNSHRLSTLTLKQRKKFLAEGNWKGVTQTNNCILVKGFIKLESTLRNEELEIKEKQKRDEEKKLVNEIDWDDFEVVEVVEFEVPEVPAPKKPKEEKKTDEILIIKDPKHIEQLRHTKGDKINYVECLFCKSKIPENEIDLHLKLELQDPKWKEIKDEITRRKEERTLNNNSDMLQYLKEFSYGRPDLFELDGTQNIEISNEKVWDGYAPNVTRTTANVTKNAMQKGKHYEDQEKLKQIKLQNEREAEMLKNNIVSNLGTSIIDLKQKQTIRLFVLDLAANDKIALDVEKTLKVKELRSMINESQLKIEGQYKLEYTDELKRKLNLLDDKTLSFYNIENNSKIYIFK